MSLAIRFLEFSPGKAWPAQLNNTQPQLQLLALLDPLYRFIRTI